MTWPEGISDGLTLDCGACGLHTDFDYRVSDELWKRVAPEQLRLGVICLSCFDKLAAQGGIDISLHLEQVQYTGIGKTVVLEPKEVHHYEARLTFSDKRVGYRRVENGVIVGYASRHPSENPNEQDELELDPDFQDAGDYG